MNLHKHFLTTLVLTISIFTIYETAYAKSVYVISDTSDSEMQAYKINGTSLIHQTDYVCVSDSVSGTGAVGLAIDESEYGDFLFVTFEDSDEIELVNAKTMKYIDVVTAPGATNLAGITMDMGKSRLYAVDRYTNHLYSYSWNPITKILTSDFNNPYYVELEDISTEPYKGAFGIALDEENGLLYVADNTNSIKYYDTNDWSKIGEVNNISCNVISVAIDVNNQLLYYGSMGSYGEGDTNLYQYDISAKTEDSVNVGSPVAGIAVDQNTSLVYITTYSGGTNPDRLIIYNSNLVKQAWDSGSIGNPAGIAVGTTAQYKPPLLKIRKIDDAGPDNRPLPGQYIDYTIFYDANGHSINNLDIIDYLPEEVSNLPNDVNFSEPNGTYDPNTHTVTWNIGPLSPTDANSVTLNVRIDPNAPFPLETIVNFVEAESDSSYNSAYCLTPDVIYVDADASAGSDTGLSWQNALLDLQHALRAAKIYNATRIWVAKGTYRPTSDPNDSAAAFNLEDNLTLYGGFAANENHLSQRNYLINKTILFGDIDDNNSYDIEYVVKAYDVNQSAILDGFTIKAAYYAGIYIENASPIIRNNNIRQIGDIDTDYGIYCRDGASPAIMNCNITDINDYGIYCHDADETKISNCTIKQNGQCGIYSLRSPLNITNCLIKDNNADGIYADYDDDINLTDSTIENSVISGNEGHGIYLKKIRDANTWIINNCIYSNGTDDTGNGIYFDNYYKPYTPIIIRNNTVTKNADYGIQLEDDYPEDADISNCIIWNNANGELDNCTTTYSCVKNGGTANHNINSDPCFADPNNDDYHITADSHCIDAGNTALITDINETDIDGQPRILDGNEPNKFDPYNPGLVDIGADEWYDFFVDFHSDGIVNFRDFAVLADTWWLTPADSNYDNDCNLAGPNSIDGHDLRFFCDYWLWKADWFSVEQLQMMRAGSTTYMTTTLDSASATALYTPTPDQLLKFQPPQPDIEEIIKWLEELIENEDLQKTMGEDEWEEFVEMQKLFIEMLKNMQK